MNNNNVNSNEVIKSLINKLATAQYENAVLEAELLETMKENEELKKDEGDK